MSIPQIRHNFDKKFICIEYPGVVNNVDKAIKTLGGKNAISMINSTKNRRLELHFRPDDPYCKPTFSNKYSITGLLLKVRVKKNKSDGSVKILSTEVAGVVETIYKFEGITDFQYLPLAPKVNQPGEPPRLKCILDELVPKGILEPRWFNSAQQYFLVPPLFSRVDTPQNYAFRNNADTNNMEKSIPNLVSNSRKKRYSYASCLAFNHVDVIPTKPKKKADSLLQIVPKEAFEKIKQLFEEKPIWSKVGLLCVSKLSNAILKFILPNVAYYYTSGPWRILWIKFGYDPRKDPQSRIYQHIDFRVRNTGGLKTLIKSSRNESSLILTIKNQYPKKKESIEIRDPTEENKTDELSESVYIFTPGSIPPQLQTFYQYCNIHVPEIEELLSKLGEVLPGALCHEKRGWMPIGFDEKCRQIMNHYVTDRMRELSSEKIFKNNYNYPSTSATEDDSNDLCIEDLNIDANDGAISEYECDVEFENIDDDEFPDDIANELSDVNIE